MLLPFLYLLCTFFKDKPFLFSFCLFQFLSGLLLLHYSYYYLNALSCHSKRLSGVWTDMRLDMCLASSMTCSCVSSIIDHTLSRRIQFQENGMSIELLENSHNVWQHGSRTLCILSFFCRFSPLLVMKLINSLLHPFQLKSSSTIGLYGYDSFVVSMYGIQ